MWSSIEITEFHRRIYPKALVRITTNKIVVELTIFASALVSLLIVQIKQACNVALTLTVYTEGQ